MGRVGSVGLVSPYDRLEAIALDGIDCIGRGVESVSCLGCGVWGVAWGVLRAEAHQEWSTTSSVRRRLGWLCGGWWVGWSG